MKRLFFALLITTTLFSCKKETITQNAPHEKAWYRVLAIGKDTSKSSSMNARTESYSYADLDDYLEAKILGYTSGQYVVEIKNKQSCKADIQFSYDGVGITDVSPNPKNSINYNEIPGNSTKVFYLTGKLKTGKIKIKALTICNWCGSDPKWLKLDVSVDLLPINFIENRASYDVKTNKVTVAFTIDDPSQIDQIIIQKQDGIEWKQAMLILCDKVTKAYNIKL